MSILIKGKKMPKRCLDCPCFDYEYAECQVNVVATRENGCPLVEVPTPHGRLIDADKLVDAIASLIPMPTDVGPYELGFCDGIGRVQIELEDSAPTVIEAEEARA